MLCQVAQMPLSNSGIIMHGSQSARVVFRRNPLSDVFEDVEVNKNVDDIHKCKWIVQIDVLIDQFYFMGYTKRNMASH